MRTSSLPDPTHGSPGLFGWALGLSWFGIMSAGPVAFWGASQLFAQPPAFLAMLAAVASFPAIGLMMIAGAWRTSWLAAQRLDAAIASLTEEIRRRGDDPNGGGPRAEPEISVPPQQFKSATRAVSKPARTVKTRDPLAPAIQGFAEDAAATAKPAKRERREKTMAANARAPRKTAVTASAARAPSEVRTRQVPASETAATEPVAPPQPRAARTQPVRPSRADARLAAEQTAEAPPPILDRAARRMPTAPRLEMPHAEMYRPEPFAIEALRIEPPPIAQSQIDALSLETATQRAVVDLTAMRRRRRAMRLGA